MAEKETTFNVQDTRETEVVFKKFTDRKALRIETEKGEVIYEISGYGLDMKLNRDVIHGVEDLEALLDGIRDMFRKDILRTLLGTQLEKENS